MSSSRRALGFSLVVLAVLLSVALYLWLPVTADTVDRLVVAMSLPFPLLVGGVVVFESLEVLGRVRVRRLLLAGAAIALLGARTAARLYDVPLSSAQETAYLVMLLVLLGAMVWSWRPAPANTSAR